MVTTNLKVWRPIVWLCLLLLLAGCQGEETENDNSSPTVVVATVAPATSPPDIANPPPAAPNDTPATTSPATPTTAETETQPIRPVTEIHLLPIAGDFDRPIYISHAFDERLFVVEQVGVIRLLPADSHDVPDPFLDIRDRVGSDGSEQGLLSVAFHPDYAANGYFYVNYTDNDGNTVIARYQVSSTNPNQANAESEQVILQIDQPYPNHNGGQLQFGPDGYLYIGMGDGGSGGDPEGNGQDQSTLLGDLLRIDVDGGEPYIIPADNPFANDDNRRGEIWASGLRNPWRFSFDRLTGDLYIADVGQGEWEEVNFQAAGQPGGDNYGWNIMEATHCFRSNDCDPAGLILPVAEYAHDQGCSVTGGYVYRGSQFPELAGNYFFADYCSGIIWSLLRDESGRWQQTLIADTDYSISTFGEDAAGELYLADRSSGTIFQLQP